MLLVSFLRKSFFLAGGLAGWLTGYVAQIVSISCTNAFLAALSWRHGFFFCAISTIKQLLLEIKHFTTLWILLVLSEIKSKKKNPLTGPEPSESLYAFLVANNAPLNPSSLQTTSAASCDQFSSQIVPHWPSWYTSIRPPPMSSSVVIRRTRFSVTW